MEEAKENIENEISLEFCFKPKLNPSIIAIQKALSCYSEFLTNDIEKNDWLLRNKTELVPFSHYIINTHIQTDRTLYIFQSRDKIRLTYNSVYIDDSEIDEEGVITEVETISEPEQTGLKIIGKIELPSERFIANEYKYYDEISESEFLNQLKQSEDWAKKYGDGFVGVRNFIETFLGQKGYHFKSSYSLKDRLVENKIIEEYKHEPEESFYNPVTAIRIKRK